MDGDGGEGAATNYITNKNIKQKLLSKGKSRVQRQDHILRFHSFGRYRSNNIQYCGNYNKATHQALFQFRIFVRRSAPNTSLK